MYEIVTPTGKKCTGRGRREPNLTGRVFDRLTVIGIDPVRTDRFTYVNDNCVPCCATCNRMKLDKSGPDFLQHIRRVYIFTYGGGNGVASHSS